MVKRKRAKIRGEIRCLIVFCGLSVLHYTSLRIVYGRRKCEVPRNCNCTPYITTTRCELVSAESNPLYIQRVGRSDAWIMYERSRRECITLALPRQAPGRDTSHSLANLETLHLEFALYLNSTEDTPRCVLYTEKKIVRKYWNFLDFWY